MSEFCFCSISLELGHFCSIKKATAAAGQSQIRFSDNSSSLLLDQLTTNKYATRLVDRNISHIIGEEVFCLTCEDDKTTSKYSREADTCNMIILHCLNIRTSLLDAIIIIVTNKVTRHICISTACTVL